MYENIFISTLTLDWWSGYRLLGCILFSFKIEGISYFLLTSWLLLRRLKLSDSWSFAVTFFFLSGSLWDLFKMVGYFHPLYDLLVGFRSRKFSWCYHWWFPHLYFLCSSSNSYYWVPGTVSSLITFIEWIWCWIFWTGSIIFISFFLNIFIGV